jgi:hypothetical protein
VDARSGPPPLLRPPPNARARQVALAAAVLGVTAIVTGLATEARLESLWRLSLLIAGTVLVIGGGLRWAREWAAARRVADFRSWDAAED